MGEPGTRGPGERGNACILVCAIRQVLNRNNRICPSHPLRTRHDARRARGGGSLCARHTGRHLRAQNRVLLSTRSHCAGALGTRLHQLLMNSVLPPRGVQHNSSNHIAAQRSRCSFRPGPRFHRRRAASPSRHHSRPFQSILACEYSYEALQAPQTLFRRPQLGGAGWDLDGCGRRQVGTAAMAVKSSRRLRALPFVGKLRRGGRRERGMLHHRLGAAKGRRQHAARWEWLTALRESSQPIGLASWAAGPVLAGCACGRGATAAAGSVRGLCGRVCRVRGIRETRETAGRGRVRPEEDTVRHSPRAQNTNTHLARRRVTV